MVFRRKGNWEYNLNEKVLTNFIVFLGVIWIGTKWDNTQNILINGEILEISSGVAGNKYLYRIYIPPDQEEVAFELWGDGLNVSFYVQSGNPPLR